MELDQDRVCIITHAIGRAVMEMRFGGLQLSEQSLSEKLEDMRQRETNVIGKGVYREAAELVRTGEIPGG